MKELKTKLRLKSAELLVILVLFLFSLRVLNWFEHPYIVAGEDFKPPLVHEAFIKRVMYSWDETDFGMPSVYPPRILSPARLMILPCLATFTMGIKSKSYKLMTVSALFFVLTYGQFPNYAVTLLCFISLALTSLFMLIRNEVEVIYTRNEPLKKWRALGGGQV